MVLVSSGRRYSRKACNAGHPGSSSTKIVSCYCSSCAVVMPVLVVALSLRWLMTLQAARRFIEPTLSRLCRCSENNLFRTGNGTTEFIVNVHCVDGSMGQASGQLLHRLGRLSAGFLDLKATFDKVLRSAMRRALRLVGCDEELISAI